MAQIRNFGFVPFVQKSYLQHQTRPGGRAGKQRRKSESDEHAVCLAHHSGTHGKGFGSDVPIRYYGFQFADGTVFIV